MPRIAFARLQQESNALSPATTTQEEFERNHFLKGAELLERCQKGAQEVEGFIKNAELSGFVQGVQDEGREGEVVDEIDLCRDLDLGLVVGVDLDQHLRFEAGLSEGLRDFRDLFGVADPAAVSGSSKSGSSKCGSSEASQSRRSRSGSRKARVSDEVRTRQTDKGKMAPNCDMYLLSF